MLAGSQNNDFKKIFYNDSQPMLLIDPAFKTLCFANDSAAELLGYSRESLRQIPLESVLQLQQECKDLLQENFLSKQDNKSCRNRFCLHRKDMSVFCANFLITPVCSEDKKIVLYLFRIEKTSKCKQEGVFNLWTAENQRITKQLFSSESRLKAIFNSAGDCIFIKDKNLRYLDVNPCMEKKFNMPFSQIIGKTDADIFGPEAARKIENVDRQVLQGKIISLEDAKEVNNIPYVFHVIKVPIKDEKNNIIGLCGIARDITARKKSEEALRKYEIQLETQNKVLMTKNFALKELISQIEQEKDKIKQNISTNIENEILPLLGKAALKGRADKYVMLIRKHLNDINSTLLSAKKEKDYNFTPREAEISRLIRDGLTSKEIAQLLNISSQTIDKHRQNIRKKLGLNDKSTNLTAYLSKR